MNSKAPWLSEVDTAEGWSQEEGRAEFWGAEGLREAGTAGCAEGCGCLSSCILMLCVRPADGGKGEQQLQEELHRGPESCPGVQELCVLQLFILFIPRFGSEQTKVAV